MKQFTNRLINETSPYLLQHAHNPVDWFPWGEEAFQAARDQNKAIFLSIGYSSCHWCHVMEHESFEKEEIAAVMNAHFINIKVDREERPDIDQVYMQYVQVTTGSGGWPMSLFLTPDQKPFYGGTYFPPDDAYGRPGFKRVLTIMADYYREKDKLASNLAEFDRVFAESNTDPAGGSSLPDANDWQMALQTLATFYEPRYGGIGRAPKFPAVNVFDLFLRHYRQNGDENYLRMTTHTLKNMADGGIYDQAGGGFARYSVDEQWLVPHFEKMLYDNGQLVCLYLDTYVVTKDSFYLEIAQETLAFVSRELRSDEGGFYSSLDADSEGEEGRFYVWTKKEIYDCLGKQRADIITTYYGVSEAGNFEGRNILNIVTEKDLLARKFNLSEDEVNVIITSAKKDLLKEREKRIRPGLDDKIIASWNGLMLSAFARVYQVTPKNEYAAVIKENISFIQNKMFVDGRLKRTYKKGQARYDAFIEDYACLIRGILDAYEALFDAKYIAFAEQLALYANRHFRDVQSAGYFTTADNQEKLVVRMKDIQDSSMPSASGLMILNNLRLFSLTENKDFYNIAEQILTKYATQITENPYSYSSYLAGLDFFLEKPKEIVIVKKKEHSVEKYLQKIYSEYLPNKIVMVLQEGQKLSAPAASIIKEKKTADGKITVYVCHNFSCSLPLFTAEDLSVLLKS